MFTVEEFERLYNEKEDFSCQNLEICATISGCHKCPLYYMSHIDALVFILNNIPEYPHDKTFYLETICGLDKIAYYDENFKSWEVKYKCED